MLIVVVVVVVVIVILVVIGMLIPSSCPLLSQLPPPPSFAFVVAGPHRCACACASRMWEGGSGAELPSSLPLWEKKGPSVRTKKTRRSLKRRKQTNVGP